MNGLKFKKTFVLSGDILHLRLTVRAAEDFNSENKLYSHARETRGEIESQVKEAVVKYLGPEFEVHQISIGRGSVETLVIIGTVYYAIANYESFVKSIQLLVSHLRNVFLHIFQGFGPPPISVSASWTPGPGLVRAESELFHSSRIDYSLILLLYLILSHTALLSIFIWLVLNR